MEWIPQCATTRSTQRTDSFISGITWARLVAAAAAAAASAIRPIFRPSRSAAFAIARRVASSPRPSSRHASATRFGAV
jgi:hypothetical protein